MRKIAFTLAEVLITLGIIGVIAAMTLPTLVGNYQKNALVGRLKKSYSVLAQGIERSIQEEKATNYSETSLYQNCSGSNNSSCYEAFNKYFKVIRPGSYSSSGYYYNRLDCSYSYRVGEYCKKSTSTSNEYTRGYMFYLADGATLYMKNNTSFTIDVNGAEKPNTYGRDVFSFYILPEEEGVLYPTNGFDSVGAARIVDDGWVMNY